MHSTELLREAERQATICNACRYCEGLCAVFPAIEMQDGFSAGNLDHLANLCHGCGACWYDCQFATPHEFAVDIPQTLAALRVESWRRHTWPQILAPLFDRNGLAIALIAALSVAAFIAGFVLWVEPGALFAVHTGPGAFYRLMPHELMVAIFGAAFGYAILAMAMGVRGQWRAAGPPPRLDRRAWIDAIRDAGRLRNLEGGGAGCMNENERPKTRRRLYHHLTFYGFLLCFAATSVATVYHYALGRIAPYPWWDLPSLLGTIGGIGLVIGPAGLLAEKWRRDPGLAKGERFDMDTAFLAMLFLASLTGLALQALRATPAMGLLLALHLGVVFAFFLTMPYGKFVHGLHRFAALLRHAAMHRATHGTGG